MTPSPSRSQLLVAGALLSALSLTSVARATGFATWMATHHSPLFIQQVVDSLITVLPSQDSRLYGFVANIGDLNRNMPRNTFRFAFEDGHTLLLQFDYQLETPELFNVRSSRPDFAARTLSQLRSHHGSDPVIDPEITERLYRYFLTNTWIASAGIEGSQTWSLAGIPRSPAELRVPVVVPGKSANFRDESGLTLYAVEMDDQTQLTFHRATVPRFSSDENHIYVPLPHSPQVYLPYHFHEGEGRLKGISLDVMSPRVASKLHSILENDRAYLDFTLQAVRNLFPDVHQFYVRSSLSNHDAIPLLGPYCASLTSVVGAFAALYSKEKK